MELIKRLKKVFSHEIENESLVPEEFSRQLEKILVQEMRKFIKQYPHSYFVDLAQKNIRFRRMR